MRVSLKWLADLVDITLPVEELCDRLDMTGTKVEAVHTLGSALVFGGLFGFINSSQQLIGEAFGFAVERFGESNQQLTEALARIEAALAQSLTRSDEQLAYYVAQAREVIDLSISAQQGIVEDLRRLHGKALASAEGGAR